MIDEIYDKTIDTILNGVSDNYKDQLREGYKNYLNNYYQNYNDETNQVKIQSMIDFQNQYWSKSPLESRYSSLIVDKSFNELRNLSNQLFLLAKEKLINNYQVDTVSDEQANEMIETFKKLRDKSYIFNEMQANYLLSETIADYLYLYKNDDSMSLRLGREYRERKEFEELKKKKMNN